MTRLINADAVEYTTHLEPLGDGEYEYVDITYRHWIYMQPAVEAIPIEWLRSKYPLHGVYGTEDYFRKAHFVEQLIKEWNAENHNVYDREEKNE